MIDAQTQAIVSQCLVDKRVDNNCVLYYSKNRDMVYMGAGIGYKGEAFRIDVERHIEQLESFHLSDIKTIIDYQDKVLFGTDGGGVTEMDGNRLFYYTPQNSNISSDAVHSLFVDKENCLWIGTYRGGINFYSPSYDWFHVLSVGNNTLSHNVVTAIYPEKDYLYIGLDGGGLNVYNRKTGETVVYSCQNSTIAGNNILGICGDSENLWLVIYERGLCRFSRTSHTFKTYDFYL